MNRNYCKLDSDQVDHIKTLINFLIEEVCSAGGDGDALWYSIFYDTKDLFPMVREINDSLPFKFNLDFNNKTIELFRGQESLIITNDEDLYNSAPSWQQILIKY